MPPTDVTSYDPMLKDRYHSEAILNSLNDKNHLVKLMETAEADVTSGRKHIIPKRIGRNWSFGAIPSGGALPQAQRSAFAKSEIDVRWMYLRIGVDEWTMMRSRNDKGAFKKALGLEMTEAVKDAAFNRNRILAGAGKGILAQVTGAHVAQTVIEVKNPGGVTGTVMPNRYIHGDANGGMYVHFLTAASPTTIEATGTVVAANADGTDFTVDAAVSVSDGAYVVLGQTATQNSYNVEPEGILAGVDDGTYVATYHNLLRSTYPTEAALVFTSVGPLSADAMQQWIDSADIRTGGVVKLLAAEHGVGRAYLALTELDRRYTGTDLMAPDAGSKRAMTPSGRTGLRYGNIPFFLDRDFPFSMLFGLDMASWARFTWPNTGWDDKGGAVLKWVPGFDEVVAHWRLTENYHSTGPADQFRAEGITTSQVAVRAM